MLQKELEDIKKQPFVLMRIVRRFLSSVSKKYHRIRTDNYWKNNAKRQDNMYLSFVSKGENVLSAEQHASIDKYFSKYCKIRHASHAFYTDKTGVFDCRYIPDSLHHCVIDRFYNNWAAAKYLDNKCYYPLFFQDVKLPQTVAFRLNGFWFSKYGGQCIDFEQVVNLVMNEDECFIKKATDSWGGLGVYYCQPKHLQIKGISDIINKIPCDLVIQQGIKQSQTLSRINKDSVNTIRVISLLNKDGNVKIYSSILRMGIKGSRVDNASSGGISVGINENGQLKDIAYRNDGVKYDEHPSSHVKFGDITIPNYRLVKELVIRLHPRFPHFRLISWDIAIDINDEPLLIEANLCDGELDFHQLNNGPIFGDDTEIVLSEVFHK